MLKKKNGEDSPTYIGGGAEGKKFLIGSVNVWDHKWIVKDKVFEVIDPIYNKSKKFMLYSIVNNNAEINFIAGEFSNGMWGFYRPPSDMKN